MVHLEVSACEAMVEYKGVLFGNTKRKSFIR
jgi:hypothetical protein